MQQYLPLLKRFDLSWPGCFPARLVFAGFSSVESSDDRSLFLLSCIQGDLSMFQIYSGIAKNKAKDKMAKIPIRQSDTRNN